MAKEDCLGCGQKFKQKDASVQCAVCGLWTHKTCAGLSNEVFNCLAEQFRLTKRAYWACRSCTNYAEGMNHRLKELEDKTREAVRLGQENEQEIKRLRVELDKKSNKSDVDSCERNIMAEMNERELRRKNVVIYGMAEAGGNTAKQRMEQDRAELNNIFIVLDINIEESEDVEFCRRLGEPGENPRPLLVGFYIEWSKSVLLKNAKKLDSTNLRHISISPDLTQQQRKAEAELLTEAERRNQEDLTDEDAAKNLAWMVVGRKGQKRIVKGYRQAEGRWPARGSRGSDRMRDRGAGRARGMAEGRKRGREETAEATGSQPKRGHRGPPPTPLVRGRGTVARGRPRGRPATAMATRGAIILGDETEEEPEEDSDNNTIMETAESREEEEEIPGEAYQASQSST